MKNQGMQLYSAAGLNAEGKGYLAAWVHNLPNSTRALASKARQAITRRRVTKALKVLGWVALSPLIAAFAVYGTGLILLVYIVLPLTLLP